MVQFLKRILGIGLSLHVAMRLLERCKLSGKEVAKTAFGILLSKK